MNGSPRPNRAALAPALMLAVVVWLVAAGTAWASDPFPVEETFRGAAFGSQWRHGGSAELTGGYEAEGWLRLTSAANSEFGYAYDDEAFSATDGALVEFEYADWGGDGADGLTFFLFDGSTGETEFHAGQPGGSLGYAPCNATTNGLSNAYVGVGFDEYGNFTNLGSICGLDGTEFLPNHVSVRGGAAENYKLLATAPTSESLLADRPQARRVTIAVTPAGRLSVYIRYPDGTYQAITEGFQLPAAPPTLKFGYVASTGGLDDYHEIRDAQVMKPTQLTPSVAQTAGGDRHGEALTWTAVVRNEGPNATQREQLRASTGAQSLAGVRWTCEAADGAECAAASGTGLPSAEAGAMPQGSSFTYKITGTPTSASEYAQLTIESEPRGDTGELDPERERATATTELAPLFEAEPSFTLAADGEARATPVDAIGSEISYTYGWQRCEPSGGSGLCTDIAGAEAGAYHTTAADLGDTIRFTETATNAAGSATVASAVYKPLPTAEIVSAPAQLVSTGEAEIAFATSTLEATLECSLDGAAWSACTSPMVYEGLAEGEHTFSVRAVYGGLSDPDPALTRWAFQTPFAPPPPSEQGSTAPPQGSQPSAPAATSVVAPMPAAEMGAPHVAPRHRKTDRFRGKHKPKAKTRAVTRRRQLKAKTRAFTRMRKPKAKTHTFTHTRTRKANAHGIARAPKETGRAPAATRTPRVKRPRYTHPRRAKAKTHPSSENPRRTELGSSTPGGAPAPAEKRHRRAARRVPRAKTPGPAAPSPSAPAPARAHKVKDRESSPVAKHAPKSRTRTPAPAPAATGRKRAPRRTHAHAPRRSSRRRGGAGAKPVIRPFLPQSATLAPRALRLVKRWAAAIGQARRVVCVGYTDDLGARSANLALGLQRARTVCAKLRAFGVHAVFKAESRGERHPCASNATARGRALNRRVELRIGH